MKLQRWLDQNKLNWNQFATMSGIHRVNVRRYCTGEKVPSFETSEIIADKTKGQVMANDFMEERKARPRKAKENPKRPLVAA